MAFPVAPNINDEHTIDGKTFVYKGAGIWDRKAIGVAELDPVAMAAIGSRTYTEQKYVTNAETVTASLDALDIALALVETSLGATELNELTDVTLLTPVDRDALMYEALSGLWKNRPLVEADISDLQTYLTSADLSGYIQGTLTENYIPIANAAGNLEDLHEPEDYDVNDYGEMVLPQPVLDNIYIGNSDGDLELISKAALLADCLTDVIVTDPADGEVLIYTTNNWENTTPPWLRRDFPTNEGDLLVADPDGNIALFPSVKNKTAETTYVLTQYYNTAYSPQILNEWYPYRPSPFIQSAADWKYAGGLKMIWEHSGDFDITLDDSGLLFEVDSARKMCLNPLLAAASTDSDYYFNTKNTRTAGNLIEVLNNSTSEFLVDFEGMVRTGNGNVKWQFEGFSATEPQTPDGWIKLKIEISGVTRDLRVPAYLVPLVP